MFPMFRRLALMLLFCCMAGSASSVQGENLAEPSDSPPPAPSARLTCQQLIDGELPPTSQFSLTDFQPGKHFVPTDTDQDGKWDQVVVPLFPADQKRLGQNYRAALVYFGDVPDFDALMARLREPELTVQYRPHQQNLERSTYNQLAQHYRSMDFSKCVLAYSGFPETSSLSSPWLIGGGMLLLGGLIIGAWQKLNGGSVVDKDRLYTDGSFAGVELVTDKQTPHG